MDSIRADTSSTKSHSSECTHSSGTGVRSKGTRTRSGLELERDPTRVRVALSGTRLEFSNSIVTWHGLLRPLIVSSTLLPEGGGKTQKTRKWVCAGSQVMKDLIAHPEFADLIGLPRTGEYTPGDIQTLSPTLRTDLSMSACAL